MIFFPRIGLAGAALTASVLLLATAPPAFGVVLGDIELRSSLGQPLRAWIPYTLGPNEWVDAACVRLLRGSGSASADIPAFVNATPRLQSQAGRNFIVFETVRPIDDLIVRLIVDVRCGPSVRITREYVLLPDQQDQAGAPMAMVPDAVSVAPDPAVDPIAKAISSASARAPRQASVVPRVEFPSSVDPIAKAISSATARAPRQASVIPRAEFPAARPKADPSFAMPRSSRKPAEVRSPPRRLAGTGRPVLRIEQTLVEGVDDRGAANCCFKLSYDLTERGPPPSEAERERLREEMRDPADRLQALAGMAQALRQEADMLKGQIASSAKKLQSAEALSQQRDRTVRELKFYGALAAVVLVLGLGAWLWSTMRRQRNLYGPGNIDSYGAAEEGFDRSVAPVETVIPVLTEPEARPTPPVAEPRRPDSPTRPVAESRKPDSPPRPVAESRKPDSPPRPVAESRKPDSRTRPVAESKREDAPARVDFDISQDAPDTRFGVTLPAHIAAPLDPALRAAEYKKAYIVGRFPEIAAGNIVLANPASVIEGARIFYQDDHNPAKAVELLRVALATHPEAVHLWLALFEILSLERMAPEFADLAQRYHDTRDVRADSHWPRIAKLGRALESGNKLYRAAGLPAVEGSNPNWLNSQLDMMGDVLALELRTQVLESHDAAGPTNKDGRG